LSLFLKKYWVSSVVILLTTSCTSLNKNSLNEDSKITAGKSNQIKEQQNIFESQLSSDVLYDNARLLIQQGKWEEGLSQLTQLANAHPENARYKTILKIQQGLYIGHLTQQAEEKRLNKLLAESENIYLKVLSLDAKNQRALDGLNQVHLAQKHSKSLEAAKVAFAKNDTDAAQNIVRDILAEDAKHQEARDLYEKIEDSQIKKITEIPQIKTAFKKTISIELKNVPIKTVFELIGKTANLNFTFDQTLSPELNTSIFVRNTSIEDAIQVILTSNQLGKKILNENTLLIYPLSRAQEYQELFVRSFYLNSLDAKRAMNMIKTVLKAKDIYIDEKLNTLIMRDTADNVKIAEKLISSQDMIEPEVMLEVEVMEINRKNLEAIGVRFPTQASIGVQGRSSTTNGTVNTTPGRLTIAELKNFNSDLGVFSISDPVIAMNLLQQNTDSNLLANPQIRVKNREKAKIHVGDKIPVLTSVANNTGFVSQTVSYLDVGIKLDVEPTILLQNQVNIKVGLEVSNVTDQVKTDNGVLAYTIGSRNAITILQLKDGETQMLAGLFRDDNQRTTNKVPGLSNLPIIGRLFTDNNDDKRKNEIVLLITPRILHNIAPANAVYSLFPTGPNRDLQGNGNLAPKALETSIQTAPETVQTPQAMQADREKLDKSFSSQLTQPPAEAGMATQTGN
jgi:general secretion pathway protein D